MANITGNIDLGQWLGKMYGQYTTGRAEEKAMFGKGVGALEQYADIFRPGGEYGAGIEAMIGRGEKKAVASGYQNLVSAGLSNTTMPMHLQQTYQEEIGMPTRLRAEDTRMERLGGALGSLGQMYAGYDAGGPTGGDIAHMATGGFSTMMQSRIADMNAQLEMSGRPSKPHGNAWEDMFPSSGGAGGGASQFGLSGFTSSYGEAGGTGSGGGGGGGGFAEGGLPVYMGGQRVGAGTEIPWEETEEGRRELSTWWDQMQRASAFGRPVPPKPTGPMGGGETPGDPNDPFFNYAADLTGISQYI